MKVKIYKPTKTAMQSGKQNTKKWVLEYTPANTRFIEPIMGWTGNADTKGQIKLKFDTEAEAIAYAKRKKLQFDVIEPKKPKVKIQAYAENFL